MKWIVLLTLLCLCQGKKKPPKPPKAKVVCPKGWILSSTRCFLVSSDYFTYTQAKKECEDHNSQLAPPITCDLQMILNTVLDLQRRKSCKKQWCDEFWIGIHDNSTTGGVWTTTRGIHITKSGQCQHWEELYPRGDGRCVLMSYQQYWVRGQWRNTDCAKKLKYVCMTCPDKFEYVPEIDECFFIKTERLTWSAARSNCAKLSVVGELLTIKSRKKQKAVARFLQTTNRTGCRSNRWASQEELFWMGGQTQQPSQCSTPYIWKPVRAAPTPFTYSHWYPGVPNCGNTSENCAAVSSAFLSFRWSDLNCDNMWCSICEF